MSLRLSDIFLVGAILTCLTFVFCQSWTPDTEEITSRIETFVHDQYPEHINTSPDGHFRLYKSRDAGTFTLYLESNGDTTRRILDRHGWSQLSVKWNSLSDNIIYQAYEPKVKGYQFFVLDVYAGTKNLISNSVSKSAMPPVIWSPEGRQVAFLLVGDRLSLEIIDVENRSTTSYYPKDLTTFSHYQWESDSTIIYNAARKGKLIRLNILTRTEEVLLSSPGLEIKQFALERKSRGVALVGRKPNDLFYSAYLYDIVRTSFSELYAPSAQVEKIAWLSNSEIVIQVNRQGHQKLIRYNERGLHKYGPEDVGIDIQLNHDILFAKVQGEDTYPSLALMAPDSIGEYPLRSKPNKVYDISGMMLGVDSIPAFLYKPVKTATSHKAVIHLHGGPHLQSMPYWQPDRHHITSLGYYFLTVNYRGSSGYARTFADAGSLPNQVADLKAAITYVRDTLRIAEKEIFIYTESYASQIAYQHLAENSSVLGGIIMLSPTLDAHQLIQLSELKAKGVRLFYGAEDPYLQVDLDQLSVLADQKKHIDLTVFDYEGHHFHLSGSWVEVLKQMTFALD